MGESPFLRIDERDWVASTPLAFAVRDRFPVSPGHTLIVPRRVVATWFAATRDEQLDILALIDEVKRLLDAELAPDGYNVGFNAGVAAGQTVMHLHVHVIPRFTGDMEDPRGGVRGVIPSKQKYAGLAPLPASPFASLPTFVHGDDLHFVHTLRTALQRAERADIVSAFLQTSGLQILFEDLRDALRRGTQVRLLVGDYMGITSADALRQLLSLADEDARLSPFLFEVGDGRAFHPKAYLFVHGSHGVAYVGSSNLSRSALTDGVEWNLRLVQSDDIRTFAGIRSRFEKLLESPRTKPLTRELIDAYERRAPERPLPSPEPRAPLPDPTPIQLEALEALKNTRREDKRKGLVVLATGLGKTFLSAFDFKNMGGERALFVAHREEILDQAKDSWRRVFPDKVVGTYQGNKRERDVDLLFASVQTLARSSHLSQFSPTHFDYIVVDEFHHAAASTYRKILGHFTPRFLLGLTATPERMDGRALLELCGENLVFRRGLVEGIARKALVPFRYFGVKDDVDFAPIPWRSGRFDAEQLTAAVATTSRADQALAEYRQHAGSTRRRRSLCFCCTVAHADYMAAFFEEHGIRAASVHSGATSASRAQSLRELRDGTLEVICAVDVFNEGLDVPDINTVLMLRPTESPVIFLQQLGRGLRRADGKDALVVIDFIGNHRSFLTKPQSLLFLLGEDLPPRVALEKIRAETLELPEGCSIKVETAAIDMLAELSKASNADVAIYEYMRFRDTHGRRPTAPELFGEGVSFEPLKKDHESWFHFVRAQGDATDAESRVLDRHAAWFRDLLRTRMTKAYKMSAVRALIDADALFVGMDVGENARRARESTRDNLLLFRELREDDERREYGPAFVRRWRAEPLEVWARGDSTSRSWFRIEGDSFVPTFEVEPGDRAAFEAMTEELVELRLCEHRDRLLRKRPVDATQAPILLDVSHSNRRPILRFDRSRRPELPEGPTVVRVDGEPFTLDFKKIAVNVAHHDGSSTNALPEVLRRMFGPSAGLPGMRHRARLARDDDGWRLDRDAAATTRDDGALILFPRLPFYADVKVACGAMAGATQSDEISQIRVRTGQPVDPAKHFVVRAEGESMNGGDAPIADGDLLLCEWTRGASAESVQGRPHLLVGHDSAETSFAVVKVPIRRADGWWLESWNPAFAPTKIPSDTRLEPVAKVLRVVDEPEGLVLYGEYDRDVIAEAFGSENNPSWRVGHRDIDVGDEHHTILMVTLRKAGQIKIEHRYADRFLSPTELQWESQASTAADGLKGRRIRGAEAEARTIHLFVQYDSHQQFTYLGPVRYVSHEGERPMRVKFELKHRLPDALWRIWS